MTSNPFEDPATVAKATRLLREGYQRWLAKQQPDAYAPPERKAS